MLRKAALAVAGVVVLLGGLDSPAAAADCCTITGINLRTSVVTAEDSATKQRFQILVENAVLLHRLRAGQAVDVDMQNSRAAFAGIAGRFPLFDEAAQRTRAAANASPPAFEAPPAPAAQVAPPAEVERFEAPRPPPFAERRGPEPSFGSPSPYPSYSESTAPSPAPPPRDIGPMRDKPIARRDPRAKDPPNDDANEDDEPDPPKMVRKHGLRLGAGARAIGKPVRLDKYPDAQGFLRKVAEAMTRKEIDVSLIGGEKYMVNSCFGIKVRAGNFRLKLASPNARLEGTAAKLTFRVERISMNGISLRMRPSTNVLKPCHFGSKFSVGGSASNVRVEFSFDPIMDFARCKFGSFGKTHTRVDIGNLNLKPLQNDLDRMAKNAVEDALNNVFNFDPNDQIVQTIDDVLEIDCPGKKM
jgi:hypothetical protein